MVFVMKSSNIFKLDLKDLIPKRKAEQIKILRLPIIHGMNDLFELTT